MATPFYVSPDQMMKDRADYARKGIARGRALVALEYEHGVVFVGENPSKSLYKTSEIYDRIAFAAVGKYNEYESMRVAGIRLADVKGYQYDRSDVVAKSLANAYSQALGSIFLADSKPYEVELLIAQVNLDLPLDLYRILYDGSIVDEHNFVAIGGESAELTTALEESWQPDMDRDAALRVAVAVLRTTGDKDIPSTDLEVSGLDIRQPRRRFFRMNEDEIARSLG